MTHVRTAIRNAAAEALRAIPGYADRVHVSRYAELAESDLPCLLVYPAGEEISETTLTRAGSQVRNVGFSILVVAPELAAEVDGETVIIPGDITCDAISADVEAALLSERALRQVCLAIELKGTSSGQGTEGEVPVSYLAMQFVAEIHTRRGAPTTP